MGLRRTPERLPGGDLWRYAPVRDGEGRNLCDLMMLIPGLKQGRHLPLLLCQQLQEVLVGFDDRVCFAEVNERLGIVWVTVAPEPGLCGLVADAIRARIDGARVVGNYARPPAARRLPWMTRVRRLLLLS